MSPEVLDKVHMYDEWIEILETMIRDVKNERNKIILENRKENDHE